MADVRTREPLARWAGTFGIERAWIRAVRGVSKVEAALPRQCRTRPRRACGQNAIEHVDPARDYFDDSLRIADTHEVPRLRGGQSRRRPLDAFEHLVLLLADGEAAECVAVEVERGDLLDRPTPQLGVGGA